MHTITQILHYGVPDLVVLYLTWTHHTFPILIFDYVHTTNCSEPKEMKSYIYIWTRLTCMFTCLKSKQSTLSMPLFLSQWSLSYGEPSFVPPSSAVVRRRLSPFFNQIGSLSFIRFPDIWLECIHQNFRKTCTIRILIFFALIFYICFNWINKIFKVFPRFLKEK